MLPHPHAAPPPCCLTPRAAPPPSAPPSPYPRTLSPCLPTFILSLLLNSNEKVMEAHQHCTKLALAPYLVLGGRGSTGSGVTWGVGQYGGGAAWGRSTGVSSVWEEGRTSSMSAARKLEPCPEIPYSPFLTLTQLAATSNQGMS